MLDTSSEEKQKCILQILQIMRWLKDFCLICLMTLYIFLTIPAKNYSIDFVNNTEKMLE